MIFMPCSPSPAAVICLKPSCVSASLSSKPAGHLIVDDQNFDFLRDRHYSVPSFRAAVSFSISSPMPFSGSWLLDGAKFEGGPGHAVDDAGLFVLAEGAGAGLAHGQQTRGAVAAHAGQDHADRVAACQFGDRIEQHVHRRPVAVDRCAGRPGGSRAQAALPTLQMPFAAGRQIDPADPSGRRRSPPAPAAHRGGSAARRSSW